MQGQKKLLLGASAEQVREYIGWDTDTWDHFLVSLHRPR